jgi:hypothetical protein
MCVQCAAAAFEGGECTNVLTEFQDFTPVRIDSSAAVDAAVHRSDSSSVWNTAGTWYAKRLSRDIGAPGR